MPKITISYADMHEQSNRLYKISNDVKNILSQIESKSLSVSSSNMWAGQAADHFNSYIKSLTRNFDNICSELTSAAIYLNYYAENFEKIDSAIIKEASK